jgi:hypothetical protein
MAAESTGVPAHVRAEYAAVAEALAKVRAEMRAVVGRGGLRAVAERMVPAPEGETACERMIRVANCTAFSETFWSAVRTETEWARAADPSGGTPPEALDWRVTRVGAAVAALFHAVIDLEDALWPGRYGNPV